MSSLIVSKTVVMSLQRIKPTKVHVSCLLLAIVPVWFLINQASAAVDKTAKIDPGKSVVKIEVIQQPPSYYPIWHSGRTRQQVGSGVIIKDQRILTNAHIINHGRFIQVSKHNDPTKYEATIEYNGYESDLAVLKVADSEFFKNTKPLSLGSMPRMRDKVVVFGFPTGGYKLSATEGDITRIEMQSYQHSERFLLSAQTDAAINPGNSGGPVVKNGKIVGVTFQTARHLENTGYIIPAPVIQQFFNDIADANYHGVPYLDVTGQKMENRQLRAHAKMKPPQTGALINQVTYGGSAWNILQPGDVLLKIDGVAIANDASIEYFDKERLNLTYLVTQRQIGDSVAVEILRAGRPLTIEIPLKGRQDLVPVTDKGTLPTYYIIGGLVFTKLTKGFLRSWGEDWKNKAPVLLLNHYLYGQITEERQEVVILADVLDDDLNIGYAFVNDVIESLNGKKLAHLKEMVEMVEATKSGNLIFKTAKHKSIILDAQRAHKNSPAILKKYGINQNRSEDLL